MAMLQSFRGSEQDPHSPPFTSRNRRSSGSRPTAPRSAKNIEMFDFSEMSKTLPPNTGPAEATVVTQGPGLQLSSGKNLSHVPCKFFKQGVCQAGKSCPFSHDLDGSSSAEKVPCKYFQKGNCKFGTKCALAHILPDGTIVNSRNTSSSRRSGDRHGHARSQSRDFSKFGFFQSTFSSNSHDHSTSHATAEEYNEFALLRSHDAQNATVGKRSPSYITPSTSALLKDSSYFFFDSSDTRGTQSGMQEYRKNEWSYMSPSSSSSSRNGGIVLKNTDDLLIPNSTHSSYLLSDTTLSSPSSEKLLPNLSSQPHAQDSDSGHSRPFLRQQWSLSSSPLFEMSTKSRADCAIQEEADVDSEDTFFEDCIPASLGSLILTPQEKTRRASRSQSGTLSVRPDIRVESQVDTGLHYPTFLEGCDSLNCEVFAMD